MNAQLLESITKLADSLNLAKQDAKEANQRADPVLSLLLIPLISEVAELEAKAKAIQSAVQAVQSRLVAKAKAKAKAKAV